MPRTDASGHHGPHLATATANMVVGLLREHTGRGLWKSRDNTIEPDMALELFCLPHAKPMTGRHMTVRALMLAGPQAGGSPRLRRNIR